MHFVDTILSIFLDGLTPHGRSILIHFRNIIILLLVYKANDYNNDNIQLGGELVDISNFVGLICIKSLPRH